MASSALLDKARSKLSYIGRSKLRYRKRLSGKEIRLLTIFPAENQNQPLKCQLRRFSLHEAPPYEALSYVWGDPTAKARIICDGGIFMATLSLFYALVTLRLPNSVRTIWADAICINQEDLNERSEQVSLMGEVFSRAERVVIWFGRDPKELASAAKASLKIISDACRAYEKRWVEDQEGSENAILPYSGIRPGFEFYRFVQLPEKIYKELAWKALVVLFDQPWFQRTWCIQEIRLSRDSICFWGNESISSSDLSITSAWLNDVHSAHGFVPDTFPEEINYSPAVIMHDTQWTKEPLLETLEKFRPFRATDPRDKVYALYNLVEPGKEADAIIVDYKKTVRDVYADTALEIIRLSSTLRILDYVGHSHVYTESNDCYSWAPRWDYITASLRFENPGVTDVSRIWDDEPMKDLDKLNERPGFIRLLGLLFSPVSSVGVIMVEEEQEDPKRLNGTHPFLDFWNEVLKNHIPGSKEGIDAIAGMIKTLTAGWHDHDLGDSPDNQEEEEKCFTEYLTLIDHLFRVTGQENTTLYEPLSMVRYECDQKEFEGLAWGTCEQRRLFKMENGSYGLGPACMQKGDIAVILSGGDLPYILRETDQHFSFMGAAYINDIMRGALAREWRAGNIELQEYFLC